MSLQSTTIYDRVVYTQDTEPSDKRDGILWVDTSASPPDTYTRDASAETWEPVASGKVTVSDTAPTGVNEGHLWVDTSTSPPKEKTLTAGGSWVVPKIDYSEIENPPHVETHQTSGNNFEESVTFNSAFATTPYIAYGGFTAGTNTGAYGASKSKSTTSVSVVHYTDSGSTQSYAAELIAREP